MWELLKKIFTPMNIAAYIAWIAIGADIWFDDPDSTGLVSKALVEPLSIGLHLVFLICFLFCVLSEKRDFRQLLFGFALTITALLMCAIARFSSAPVLLIIASSVMAVLLSPPRLVALFVFNNVGLYLIYQKLWLADRPMMSVFMYSSFQLFAMLMSWYSHQAEKRRDEFMLLNTDLIATRSLLAETVRDSERLRLSRELHDIAGHKLTALKLNLAALVRQPDLAKQTGNSIQICADLADELLADIRGVVQQMRIHDGMDLQAAIEQMASPFPRPKLQLAIEQDARHAPVQQAEALLRTVQEALTNSARHSQAQNLWVVLQHDDNQWSLRIRDDGRMSGHWQKGNGLQGMGERLENLGGGLRCERAATGGMQIEAWLPVAI